MVITIRPHLSVLCTAEGIEGYFRYTLRQCDGFGILHLFTIPTYLIIHLSVRNGRYHGHLLTNKVGTTFNRGLWVRRSEGNGKPRRVGSVDICLLTYGLDCDDSCTADEGYLTCSINGGNGIVATAVRDAEVSQFASVITIYLRFQRWRSKALQFVII